MSIKLKTIYIINRLYLWISFYFSFWSKELSRLCPDFRQAPLNEMQTSRCFFVVTRQFAVRTNNEMPNVSLEWAHSSMSIHSWHLLRDISPWQAIYWTAWIFEGSPSYPFAPDKSHVREKCRKINVGSNLRDRFNYFGIPQIVAGVSWQYTRYSMTNNRPNMSLFLHH